MSEYGSGSNLNRKTGGWNLQDILYAAAPALLYTALSSAVYSLLVSVLPGTPGIVLQGVSLAVCLAYFSWRARKEHILIRGQKGTVYRYPACFCYAASVVLFGVACNYLIYLMGLKASSAGYRHVSEVFYGNGLMIEIAALCVIGPLAEELVYRGFVFRRLQRKGSSRAAVLLSALLFGVLHLNAVQGIYGFLLGILLAYIVYKTDSILTVQAAHMASNLTSVLWTETDWLKFLNQNGTGMYAAALLCAGLAGIFLHYGNRMVQTLTKLQLKQ